MKKVILTIAILFSIVVSSSAQYEIKSNQLNSRSLYQSYPPTRVQSGYTRSTGDYVESHHKTISNLTNTDNFSTRGNVNPFTNTSGTKPRDYSPESQLNNSRHDIQTGSRGGKYYTNSNGNKTYVSKSY